MKRIITICVLLVCSFAEAKDIQLFNPDVLGQTTGKEIKLLQDRKAGDIEPVEVLVNLEEGWYIAARIIYPDEVTFQDARASINKIYKQYEMIELLRDNEMAIWRVEDKKYVIDVIKEECKTHILYILFQPSKETIKAFLKTKGTDKN